MGQRKHYRPHPDPLLQAVERGVPGNPRLPSRQLCGPSSCLEPHSQVGLRTVPTGRDPQLASLGAKAWPLPAVWIKPGAPGMFPGHTQAFSTPPVPPEGAPRNKPMWSPEDRARLVSPYSGGNRTTVSGQDVGKPPSSALGRGGEKLVPVTGLFPGRTTAKSPPPPSEGGLQGEGAPGPGVRGN